MSLPNWYPTDYITLPVTVNKDCPHRISCIHGCADRKANLCRWSAARPPLRGRWILDIFFCKAPPILLYLLGSVQAILHPHDESLSRLSPYNGTPDLAPRESRPSNSANWGWMPVRRFHVFSLTKTLSALGFSKAPYVVRSAILASVYIVYYMLGIWPVLCIRGYILLPQAFPETLGLFVQEPVPGKLLTWCRYPDPWIHSLSSLWIF